VDFDRVPLHSLIPSLELRRNHTELCYARIRGDKAFADAERAWTVEGQSGLIENRAT